MKKDPIESSLEIISCMLSELTDDHFNTAARLLPNYARLALENRKNPAWQQSVDCIIRIIAQIEKSNRNASKMYDSLESFFILLLSESSSRRIKILAAQAWEIKFKNENISLGKLLNLILYGRYYEMPQKGRERYIFHVMPYAFVFEMNRK